MLVIVRGIGEDLFISEDIQVTILGIRGTQARIGINAPKSFVIKRSELIEPHTLALWRANVKSGK